MVPDTDSEIDQPTQKPLFSEWSKTSPSFSPAKRPMAIKVRDNKVFKSTAQKFSIRGTCVILCPFEKIFSEKCLVREQDKQEKSLA